MDKWEEVRGLCFLSLRPSLAARHRKRQGVFVLERFTRNVWLMFFVIKRMKIVISSHFSPAAKDMQLPPTHPTSMTSTSTTHFVSTVEVSSTVKFRWSSSEIDSKGWSGSVLVNEGARSLFLEQIRPPTEWSNEIHVLWPGNWRQTQVAAYLDDGTVYSSYGKRVSATQRTWRTPQSIAGVVVVLDEKSNAATINFYHGKEKTLVATLVVKGDSQPVCNLRLEVRAHPNGAVRLLPQQ